MSKCSVFVIRIKESATYAWRLLSGFKQRALMVHVLVSDAFDVPAMLQMFVVRFIDTIYMH